MGRTILIIILFVFSQLTFSQNIILSEKSEISVITIGPGTSLNDAFGHNAFRIKDHKQYLDVIFDYGQYDFTQPNFYLNFAKGKLNYSIGNYHFYVFFQHYVSENRTLEEQILNLSLSEKQALFNFLLENCKPENRNYLYEFFFDNCATKIRDVTNTNLNNTIKFNTPKGFKAETFRTLIHSNINQNSWGALGIDLALGSVIDRTATPEEHMFLPRNIYTFLNVATIKNNLPLVKKSISLYTQTETQDSNPFFTSPLFILGIIALSIISITYLDYKKSTQTKWLDILLFTLTGIFGILILLLWFATDHTGTKYNYNLLWAFALNCLVIGQFYKPKPNLWFIKYIKLLTILLIITILLWITEVQMFAVTLLPLLTALLIRYLFIIRYLTKSVKQ